MDKASTLPYFMPPPRKRHTTPPMRSAMAARLARSCELRARLPEYFATQAKDPAEAEALQRDAETWREVNRLAAEIERDKQAGVFEKRQGPLCRFCDVYDCENNSNPKKS